MKLLRFLILIIIAAFIFSSCQKEFLAEAGLTAKGTLQKDSIGDCMPILVSGSYKTDTLLNTSNYVDVSIKLTQAGTYSIKSDTINGYSFSGTGIADTGVNTVRLSGIGRPFVGGVDIFTIKFDSSVCEFNVIVTGTGGGGGGGTAGDSIVATIDGVYTTFKFRDSAKRNMTSGFDAIGILGYNNAAGFESFGLLVGTMAPLGPGTYTVNQFPAVIVAAQDTSATFAYYAQTNPVGPPQIPGFTVTITTLTATRVSGTFSGRLFDNMGAGPGFKDVMGGVFSVTIY